MSDSPDAEKDLNSPSTYVDFGALLGQYLPKIQGFLLRETRDYDSSLDLSQEVSLRAWRGFAKFRGGCSIGTWLRKITINVVHSWRASAWCRARQKFTALDQVKDLDSTRGLCTQRAYSDAYLQVLVLAVRVLPQHYREVVLAINFDGKSYAETAALLNIPVGTVCSREESIFSESARRNIKKIRK